MYISYLLIDIFKYRKSIKQDYFYLLLFHQLGMLLQNKNNLNGTNIIFDYFRENNFIEFKLRLRYI